MISTSNTIESIVRFKNSQGEKGSGTLVHITRSNIVIEVYNPYSIIQMSEMLNDLTVLRGERQIYNGRASVYGLVPTGLMIIVSATLHDTWTDLDTLKFGKNLTEETERFIQDWESSSKIRESYQIAVSSMSNFMTELSTWLEEAEASTHGIVAESYRAGKDTFLDNVIDPIIGKLAYFFRRFEEEAREVSPEHAMTHKAFARRELHPFMLCDPFSHRTYSKPLGYAGDYEMVNMMLKESKNNGSNIYARIINILTTSVAAAEAHRNRVTMLETIIIKEAERVIGEEQRIFTALNLGCGPAVEIQRLIGNFANADACSFILYDFNQTTLDYARTKLSEAIALSGREPLITFEKKSVDQLLREAQEEPDSSKTVADLVYSAGLYDYFPDHICRHLTLLLYNLVKPGGLLVITNVHPNNPNRYGMEHLLDWYLVYRDENDLLTFAPNGTHPVVRTDQTGVNVFLEIRKNN